ncbi:sal-like protein 2 [Anastrepha obliqua]|uniref:sal-like protein 2 n=1 Tax=Anastrepha obliqua TaxID=95512 RepID=UPI0024099AC7|nr:sal-like protein 2 [Anastrepha obliqua]
MSRIAIKTEKLDEEQEEIGIESRAAEEGGVSSQEHEKGTSAVAGKQHHEVGRSAMRQLQQNQLQPTALLKSASGVGGGIDSSCGLVNSSHEINSTKKPTLPKSRCGEVFVSNNARQWTFICTYCNKSTRDIGEFICHIKIKHLGGFTDEGDETDDGEYETNQQANFYEQDQDYLDCGNYLDVNVHTESEDYSLNGQDNSTTYRHTSSHNALHRQPVSAAVSKQGDVKRQVDFNKKRKNNSVDDDTLEDEKEHASGAVKESAAQWRADPANFQSYANKYTPISSTPNVKMKTNATSNGNTAFDAADYAPVKDDFDTTGAYENDEEEDFDNQLFIAPTDSLDASILGGAADGSGGEMKTKRRQIRGTAYCALCNKTFQYYSLYRNHMIKHSNETPFKCPICKKGFKSKQAIRYHMNTHQKEKQFKCSICSASYGTENHFISHIMTHESATAFPCMVCGQVLSSSKERDIHMANHKEERPFRCDYCNKLFRLRHHLSNHLKMHRKYRCDYCKEIFTSAIYLRKPYACPGCENSPDAQQDAANAANSKVGRVSGNNSINPLEIFETVIPGQQQSDDYAQMVTDSEGDGEGDEDVDEDEDEADDDDNGNEPQGTQMDEDGDENEDISRREDEQEEDDDDEEEYEEGEEPSNHGVGSSGQAIGAYGGSIKRYVCKYCSRSYSHPSGLNYHIRHKHC